MFGFGKTSAKQANSGDFLQDEEPQISKSAEDSTLTKEQQELVNLYQTRATYELTTRVTNKCFDRCVQKLHDGGLDKSQAACMNNCAARFFDVKFFFTKRLVDMTAATSSE